MEVIKTENDYIKIYEGNIMALDFWLGRTDIFFKRHIEIEGEKIRIYVEKSEFNTLKEAFKQFPKLENFEHYRKQNDDIRFFYGFDNEDC